MSGRRYSAEVKEQALKLAAGHTAAAAARAIGADPSTVEDWVKQADPAALQRYAVEKRAIASKVVLDQTEAAARRVMESILHTDIQTMKDVQAAATALGIMDDHYGHRTTGQTGTRFGLTGALEHLEPGDRVIAERLVLEFAEPTVPTASDPVEPDPQG